MHTFIMGFRIVVWLLSMLTGFICLWTHNWDQAAAFFLCALVVDGRDG